jgi:hypothetical protein
MTNTITITVAMIAAVLIAFAAIPLQALAQVNAGGTVGTGKDIKLPEPPKVSVPETDLPVTAEPELPDIPEPEMPAIPELSDLPTPEL